MAKGEQNVVTKTNFVRSHAVSSFLSLSKKILGLKRSSLARKCTSLNDPFEETTLTAQFLTHQDFSTSLSHQEYGVYVTEPGLYVPVGGAGVEDGR